MLPQYPSLPLAQEAAQFAAAQLTAEQSAAERSLRLNSPIEAEPSIPTLIEPSPAPGCVGPSGPVEDSHLRRLLIGSPEGVRHAINRLHVLQYGEWRLWTPLITVVEQGIHITPAHGQVLSYLVQQRPIK
ncbi:MAG: hypothetical protein ACFB4J_06030 [Elainellaceae cyanobacterium]